MYILFVLRSHKHNGNSIIPTATYGDRFLFKYLMENLFNENEYFDNIFEKNIGRGKFNKM